MKPIFLASSNARSLLRKPYGAERMGKTSSISGDSGSRALTRSSVTLGVPDCSPIVSITRLGSLPKTAVKAGGGVSPGGLLPGVEITLRISSEISGIKMINHPNLSASRTFVAVVVRDISLV